MKNKKMLYVSMFVVIILVVGIVAAIFLLGHNDSNFNKYNDSFGEKVDLSKYYDITSDKDLGIAGVSDDTKVNTLIQDLMSENGYAGVELLEDWDDVALNVHTYTVLFDSEYLYYISVDNGKVYASAGDYEYWKEMNQ